MNACGISSPWSIDAKRIIRRSCYGGALQLDEAIAYALEGLRASPPADVPPSGEHLPPLVDAGRSCDPRASILTRVPLVSMRQLLDEAAKGGYGVAAFNVNNMEQIQAIMEAARDTQRSPVIVQASAARGRTRKTTS